MNKIVVALISIIVIGSSVDIMRAIPALSQAQLNYSDASGSVGTSQFQALAANPSRAFLYVQNMSNANTLAFTVDNTTPGINKPGSIMLAAGASIQLATKVPIGPIIVIGSGGSTYYTIKYEN